jgi:kanamycin kinase
MTTGGDDARFSDLAQFHMLGPDGVPAVVLDLARSESVDLVWRNEMGGLTFRLADRFVKWNPAGNAIDLAREHTRLAWISTRHPAPAVIDFGSDERGQWLVTAALPGEHAVGDRWRARRREAIGAIAAGLRAIHAVPIADAPPWMSDSWVCRTPGSIGDRPPLDDPVVVHGDACAPNTLIDVDTGTWTGNVDFGDLAVGDRWADLAVASLSLDWNFGEGHQHELFDAYGIEPDEQRITYYRALWHLES